MTESYHQKLTKQQEKNGKIVGYVHDQACVWLKSFYAELQKQEGIDSTATAYDMLGIMFRHFVESFTDNMYNMKMDKKKIQYMLDNAPSMKPWE